MEKISVSIVLYNTEVDQINSVIDSCINSIQKVDIYLIDNSPGDHLSYLKEDGRVAYLKSEDNGGFGAGHNLAIKHFKLLDLYDYHIVLNPDIEFYDDVVGALLEYMNDNIDVGAIMPRILNRDGSLQYARRLLPSPIDIFMKRFFSSSKRSRNYELVGFEPDQPVEIIGLCGCFMFIRTSVFKNIGLFDERYFMYFEDLDLSRRIFKEYKVIYYPGCKVIHGSNNEHKRNWKLFFRSILAALRYFYKWGFFDREAKEINIRVRDKVALTSGRC